jgi:hypothetical protein
MVVYPTDRPLPIPRMYRASGECPLGPVLGWAVNALCGDPIPTRHLQRSCSVRLCAANGEYRGPRVALACRCVQSLSFVAHVLSLSIDDVTRLPSPYAFSVLLPYIATALHTVHVRASVKGVPGLLFKFGVPRRPGAAGGGPAADTEDAAAAAAARRGGDQA